MQGDNYLAIRQNTVQMIDFQLFGSLYIYIFLIINKLRNFFFFHFYIYRSRRSPSGVFHRSRAPLGCMAFHSTIKRFNQPIK